MYKIKGFLRQNFVCTDRSSEVEEARWGDEGMERKKRKMIKREVGTSLG